MSDITEIFINVDDFCIIFEPEWQKKLLSYGMKKRNRKGNLAMSEIMTLLIYFHVSGYRNFKSYYENFARIHLKEEFPGLVSYNRFIELVPSVIIPLISYLRSCFGKCTGISFVDSTPLKVCANPRIHQHKVFKGIATRGKSSTGWFFGFKLHLVINDTGEIIDTTITPANVDDRKPVPKLSKKLFGKLFGDRGYVSAPLFKTLLKDFGINFITKPKSNMKNSLMPLFDKIMLRKRAIIETVNDQLKNISQIEHSRHRSTNGFIVNVICGLIAYCIKPKKPSLNLQNSKTLALA